VQLKTCLYTGVGLLFTGVVAAITVAAFHTTSSRSMFLGIVNDVVTVAMYAAPLEIMWLVVKTQSVKYMPFYLSLLSLANGAAWTGESQEQCTPLQWCSLFHYSGVHCSTTVVFTVPLQWCSLFHYSGVHCSTTVVFTVPLSGLHCSTSAPVSPTCRSTATTVVFTVPWGLTRPGCLDGWLGASLPLYSQSSWCASCSSQALQLAIPGAAFSL